jgi:hypothetical protein
MFLFWRLLDTIAMWLDSRGLLYTKEEYEKLWRESPHAKDDDKLIR